MSTPADRSLAAQVAAATRWGTCADRTTATKPARDGLRAKFARQADPDGNLDPAELAYRVDQLMRAHMLKMAIASKRARAAKKRGRPTASAGSEPATETSAS